MKLVGSPSCPGTGAKIVIFVKLERSLLVACIGVVNFGHLQQLWLPRAPGHCEEGGSYNQSSQTASSLGVANASIDEGPVASVFLLNLSSITVGP